MHVFFVVAQTETGTGGGAEGTKSAFNFDGQPVAAAAPLIVMAFNWCEPADSPDRDGHADRWTNGHRPTIARLRCDARRHGRECVGLQIECEIEAVFVLPALEREVKGSVEGRTTCSSLVWSVAKQPFLLFSFCKGSELYSTIHQIHLDHANVSPALHS